MLGPVGPLRERRCAKVPLIPDQHQHYGHRHHIRHCTFAALALATDQATARPQAGQILNVFVGMTKNWYFIAITLIGLSFLPKAASFLISLYSGCCPSYYM